MKSLSDLRLAFAGNVTRESIAALERQMLAIIRDSDSFDSLSPCLSVAAANYHLGSGGQRIRAVLALYAGNQLGLSPNDSQTLAAACELLHNASLIHDDLHDRDAQRRGRPSVWHKFGDEVAVCAGDLLLSASYLALSQLDDATRLPALFALMHARIAGAIRGQCADLRRPAHRFLTIDDFKNIALTKSGALLSLPTELALLAAGQDLALVRARQAAQAFAIAYQIHDDLIDLETDVSRESIKSSVNNRNNDSAVCNIVLVLQGDLTCLDARAAAKQIGLQHLSLAASASADLPLNSGGALHAMSLQLQDELERLE